MGNDIAPRLDLLELIRTGEVPEVEDPQQVQLSIIQQVLSAETLEEVFEVGGSTAVKDMLGVGITLRDVKVMRSDIEGTLPVYVLLDCVQTETGKPIVLNTSAARAMAQAWRAKELGLLPLDLVPVEVAKAKPGQNAPLGFATV